MPLANHWSNYGVTGPLIVRTVAERSEPEMDEAI